MRLIDIYYKNIISPDMSHGGGRVTGVSAAVVTVPGEAKLRTILTALVPVIPVLRLQARGR